MFTDSLYPIDTPCVYEYESEIKPPLVPYCANIVLTSALHTSLSLPALVQRLKFLEYNPASLAAAIGRFENPHMTILLSSSGKIVITGAKNVYSAAYIVQKLANLINTPMAVSHDIRIQNFTCTVTLGNYFDVRTCSRENSKVCIYVPGNFPGAHINTGIGTVTHIVFCSGYIVVTGSRSYEQAAQSLQAMTWMYIKYQLPHGSPEAIEAAKITTAVKRNKTAIIKQVVLEHAVDADVEMALDELL